jgi:hypothetical protein
MYPTASLFADKRTNIKFSSFLGKETKKTGLRKTALVAVSIYLPFCSPFFLLTPACLLLSFSSPPPLGRVLSLYLLLFFQIQTENGINEKL